MTLPAKTRLVKLVNRFLHFLTAQGSVQGLNLLNGLLLVRAMARPEYAVYALALGCQLTLSGLTELGLGGSIIALTGDRGHCPDVVGKYVRAASTIRIWLVCGSVLVGVAAIPRLLKTSGLSTATLALLLGAILAALYFQCWSSYYDAPLLIRGNLSAYYKPQIIAGFGRLALTVVLWAYGALGPITAIWLMTAYYAALGVQYRIAVRTLIVMPTAQLGETTAEMVRYLLPLVPGTLYAALSGQLSLFIIGVCGARYEIAGVAALGRLAQLFLVLTAANATLVAPALARASNRDLLRRYFSVLSLALGASLGIFVVFILFPRLITLLLGSTYQDLVKFIPLAVGASCVSYLSGTMWAMHAARKWVFWWGGSAQILIAVAIQILSVRFFPLSTIGGVLKMNLYVAAGSMVVQIAHALVGFSGNSPRSTERSLGVTPRALELNSEGYR